MLSMALATRSGYAVATRQPASSGHISSLHSVALIIFRYSSAICAMRDHLPSLCCRRAVRSRLMRRHRSAEVSSVRGSFSSSMAAMSQARLFCTGDSARTIILKYADGTAVSTSACRGLLCGSGCRRHQALPAVSGLAQRLMAEVLSAMATPLRRFRRKPQCREV